MNYFKFFLHTTDMKKLVILLLSVFTIGTVAVCGCNSASANSGSLYKDEMNTAQLQTVEEFVKEYDGEKPECPDCDERDGEYPKPCKPHKRHNKKLPRPKPAYRKH